MSRAIDTAVLSQSPVDVLPTALLCSSVGFFSPIIAHVANLSFAECLFPSAFKTAKVLPLLKKPGLDQDQMSNYRPINIKLIYTLNN